VTLLIDPTQRPPQLSGARRCRFCPEPLPATAPDAQEYCGKRCRRQASRARLLMPIGADNKRPLRFAYADPPYPDRERRRYAEHPLGEVDHAELIERLDRDYDGWALSTAANVLWKIQAICPQARTCAWGKNIGTPRRTWGIHNQWEAMLVMPGRKVRPGKPDFLVCQPARGAVDPVTREPLIGCKPPKFCKWMFGLLGMLPGDSLDDLYPGAGNVSRIWAEISRGAA
jgi:hypothetical protein